MMIQTDVFWFSQISHLCLLQEPQKSYSILSGGSLVITRMSLKLSHFLNSLLENSQKIYCALYPVLKEDKFSIKYS